MSALLVVALVFRDIAATVDGGAWLWAQDGSDSVLERLILDGGRLPVRIEGASHIEAIATRGDALWVVTPDEVIVRASWANPAVTRVEIPTNVQTSGVSVRDTSVTPLGDGRAFVMRACPNATTRADDCTEVITVDTVVGTATARTWPVKLMRAIADDRGGAWMRVEHAPGADIQKRGSVGYAHASKDGTWDLWSFDGMIVPSMMAHSKVEAFPEYLARMAGGVFGVSQYSMWPIGDSGVPRKKIEWRETQFLGVSHIHDATSSGGELVQITGIRESCCFTDDVENDDVSPVLRWVTFTGVERAAEIAPTPSWWRDEHRKGTPPAKLAVAAGVVWILFEDLVMLRAPRGDEDPEWRIVAEKHASPEATEDRPRTRHRWSFSGGLGYSRAGDDDGFARSIRLERLTTSNRKRPLIGAGGFMEAGSLGGRANVGAGVSLSLPRLGAVASVGGSAIEDANDEWHPQLVFSLFLGARVGLDSVPLEFPLGVRFEVRPATKDLPTTFMVASSVELLVVAAVGLVAAAM